MSDFEEVQQDIEALEREIKSLKSKIGNNELNSGPKNIQTNPRFKQFLSESIDISAFINDEMKIGKKANILPKRSGDRTNTVLSHSIDPSIRAFFNEETNFKTESVNEYVRWENSMRMFGISFFPIHYESTEYMGIRLEIFEELTSTFKNPYYIICKPSEKCLDLWELFRHNLPKYVKITQHWELITSRNTKTSDLELLQFAQQCYKDLLTVHQRVQYFHKLDRQLQKFSLLRIDDLGTNVMFRLNDHIFELEINMENEVTSCTRDNGNGIILLGNVFEISSKLDLLV